MGRPVSRPSALANADLPVPGTPSSNTPRGHSSLFGAVDALILVEKVGSANTWKLDASKDDADGDKEGFKLEIVTVGVDEDGDPIKSCVVVPTEVEISATKAKLTSTEKSCLKALENTILKTGKIPPFSKNIPTGKNCVEYGQWEVEAKAVYPGNAEDKKKAFQRGPKGLLDKGKVGMYQDLYWIVDD